MEAGYVGTTAAELCVDRGLRVEQRGIRVLVVDDTEHIRTVVADMLRLDGFDVVGTADSGAQALVLAAETDPHVVVMDLRMPDMDGLEATRQLRAARPGQQVVLYTAFVDAEVERAAREVGAALCLGKVEGLPRLERELVRLTLAVTKGG
jgi:DNA-binding NarL/FixJ family response regulator